MKTIDIEKILDDMTIDQCIGQVFMANVCGGENLEQIRRDLETFHFGGLQFSAVFQKFVRGGNYLPCGVSHNRPLAEDAHFLSDVKQAALEVTGVPLIMGGDQEGGIEASIFRRRNISTIPTQMGLGSANDPQLTYQASLVSAREVKVLGLDMLYGPSLDVNTNPDNPEIGSRAFSDDPEVVAEHGAAVIRAYRDVGIISNAKHFPGRGQGAANAHHSLETIDLNRKRLDEVELLPFRKAIEAGVDSIMTAHTHFPMFDKEKVPATLSRNVVTGLLREELGFDGLVIPDTLTMFAISKNYPVPEAAVRCLMAGVDMVFMKVRDLYGPVVQAIRKAVQDGRLPEEQLRDSVRRVVSLKQKMGLWECPAFDEKVVGAIVGKQDNQAVAADAANMAAVLYKNEDGLIPFDKGKSPSFLAVVPRDANVVLSNDRLIHHDMLPRALGKHTPHVEHIVVDEAPTEIQQYETIGRARNADVIIFGFYSGGTSDEQLALYDELIALGKPVIALITGGPYVAKKIPDETRAIYFSFGISTFAFDTFANVLFGKARTGGTLPVKM